MYMDKATLSYSAILGMWPDTGLTQDRYNNVNTIFYVGFFAGQIPGPYITQHFHLRPLMVIITFAWLVIIFLHCAATSYGGVIALRFFLGLTESSVIPILTSTNAMFLTQNERDATQPLFYLSCLSSSIPIGFIAYGVIYADAAIGDWRVLNIIIGGITLITCGVVWWQYPNNPTDARFLSVEEKVWTIRRMLASTNASIEQNKFKRHQAIECIKDYTTWLFVLALFLQQLANNLPYQQTILYQQMGGILNLDSTLVTVAGAGFSMLWAFLATGFMAYFPQTSYLTAIWSVFPSLLGSILAVSLPISNSVGILGAICMAAQTFGVQWIIIIGLAKGSARSQTKMKVRAALLMAGYSVANIISPQLWQEKDSPRFVPAWVVQIVLSFVTAPVVLAITWYIFAQRNKKRQRVERKTALVRVGDEEVEVPVAALDLTDLEDESYIYPL